MRRLIYVALLASCASPAQRTPSRLDVTERFVVETGGELSVTTMRDGSITALAGSSTQTMRLAADGTIEAFAASISGRVIETFTRDGARVRWSSPNETGDTVIRHAAMFVPAGAAPHFLGVLVRAAIKRGSPTLALLPTGSAIVTRVAEHAIDREGTKHHLHCYAIEGLDLTPAYTWMAADGRWFGSVDPRAAVVPVGWEVAIAPLREKQVAVERARLQKLAALGSPPPPAGRAYMHARVFDAERRGWLADHTVVVVGDAITAVGPSSSTPIPSRAEIVDLSGKAIIPGLVDMRAHVSMAGNIVAIAAGVTTVRDFDDRAGARAVDAIGPHVVRWGRIQAVTTVVDATSSVRESERLGYQGIELHALPDPLVDPVVAFAHDRNLGTTIRIPATVFTGGHDVAKTRLQDLVTRLTGRHLGVEPTLAALESSFDPLGPRQIATAPRDQVARMPLALQRRERTPSVRLDAGAWQRVLELAKRLFDAGIHVVVGSDSPAALMLHREMELLAAAGIDRAQVLALATLGNARALRLDATIGSITVGKRADLAILEGDPLADMRDIRTIVTTVRAGVAYPTAPLFAGAGVR